MLKDITLGQYFPGTSVIHRLDPRTKLLALIVYIVSLFMANNVLSYALCIAFLLTVLFLSRIQPKLVLKSLKPVVFIVILTAVLNMLYTPVMYCGALPLSRSPNRASVPPFIWRCALPC